MHTIKCLIIEDEPIAARVLSRFISQVEALELVQVCTNAMTGFDVLNKQSIDLLFLDIRMPQLDGLGLLRALKKAPKVIVTTAHAEYALDGYDLNITDYLLKPIAQPRFIKAVAKATRQISLPSLPSFDFDKPYVYLKSDKKMVRVYLSDILYLESMGNYVKVVTHNGIVVTYQTLQFFETHLPSCDFLRIHRSYIISLQKLEAYTTTYAELVQKIRLPIGQNNKTNALAAFARQRE